MKINPERPFRVKGVIYSNESGVPFLKITKMYHCQMTIAPGLFISTGIFTGTTSGKCSFNSYL